MLKTTTFAIVPFCQVQLGWFPPLSTELCHMITIQAWAWSCNYLKVQLFHSVAHSGFQSPTGCWTEELSSSLVAAQRLPQFCAM